jgi:hypothetical protein
LDTQPRRLRLSVARRTAPNSYTYAKWDANAHTYTYVNADSYPDA